MIEMLSIFNYKTWNSSAHAYICRSDGMSLEMHATRKKAANIDIKYVIALPHSHTLCHGIGELHQKSITCRFLFANYFWYTYFACLAFETVIVCLYVELMLRRLSVYFSRQNVTKMLSKCSENNTTTTLSKQRHTHTHNRICQEPNRRRERINLRTKNQMKKIEREKIIRKKNWQHDGDQEQQRQYQ